VTDLKPSKSARKREFLALQKLGEGLIALHESDIREIGLDEELLEAILDARQIKSHSALRRQKQYIGKIMRHVDPEPIRAAIKRLS